MRVQEAVELVAVDVFQRAEQTRQQVTLAMVEQRMAELRSHRPHCSCGLCTAAVKARSSAVFYEARQWAREIAATRRRAMR